MEWKPVPGFDFVEASSTGLIRTLPHTKIVFRKSQYGGGDSHCTIHVKGKVLQPIKQKSGHGFVNLATPDGPRYQRPHSIHVLVCKAFHGLPTEEKPWALHKNDDPLDNTPANLYWGTPQENVDDRTRNGHTPRGEAHHSTPLTEAQVRCIKASYIPKSSTNGSFALGKKYGVHRTTIENIVRGTTWA
jgi:hypothetical protein